MTEQLQDMPPETVDDQIETGNRRSVEEFAEQIKAEWDDADEFGRKTAEKFIKVGARLREAKAALAPSGGKKEWLKCLRNLLTISFGKKKLESRVRIAQMLMKIAGHEMANTKYLSSLPPALTTQHELTKLPGPRFERNWKDKLIDREMSHEDVLVLLGKARKANKDKNAEQLASNPVMRLSVP
jgi:hypothetical protein